MKKLTKDMLTTGRELVVLLLALSALGSLVTSCVLAVAKRDASWLHLSLVGAAPLAVLVLLGGGIGGRFRFTGSRTGKPREQSAATDTVLS